MELPDKFIQSLLPRTFLIPFGSIKTASALGYNAISRFAFGQMGVQLDAKIPNKGNCVFDLIVSFGLMPGPGSSLTDAT